jgi:two-component system sensor histidine kinase BaeS
MTDQLFSLSREDAGMNAPVRDHVHLLPLIRETLETMLPVANEKDQSLTTTGNEDIVTLGDAERLRQVLYNLLANAIKYTGPGGKIEVTLEPYGSEAVIAVHDNGIGISTEHVPYVFDRFYRADKGRSQNEGGAGLGLAIVKSIVMAHGGRVEVESTPAEGAAFRVFLPRNASSETTQGPTPAH